MKILIMIVSLLIFITTLFQSCSISLDIGSGKKHDKYDKKDHHKWSKKEHTFETKTMIFEEIEIDFEKTPLLNKKWTYTKLIINDKEYPAENNEKGNYFIFKENNQKDEVKSGKKINGSWEYLSHGKFIMFYSEDKTIYVPARIVKITATELWLKIFSIEKMKMITIIYISEN